MEHVTPEILQAALQEGFRAEFRLRTVEHLSRGCTACWRAIDEVETTVVESTMGEYSGDLVARAIGHLVTMHAMTEKERTEGNFWCHLSPILETALWTAPSEPLGFSRLVLEEARWLGVEHPLEALHWIGEGISTVDQRAVADDFPKPYADLQARMFAYLGEAGCRSVSHEETESRLLIAEEHRRQGSDAPELAATLFEIRAFVAQEVEDYEAALDFLSAARQLLQGGSRARLAEIAIRQGGLNRHLGVPGAARQSYRAALSLLSLDEFPRLRRTALHYLAAEEVEAGNFAAARHHLQEAAQYSAGQGGSALQAQSLWLYGTAQLEEGDFVAAERSLALAFDQFLQTDAVFGPESVWILVQQVRLLLLQDRSAEVARLKPWMWHLLEIPSLADLLVKELQDLQQQSEVAGGSAQGLGALLDELQGSLSL